MPGRCLLKLTVRGSWLFGDADLARLNDHETAGKFVRLFPDNLQYRSRERASCLARKPDENHASRGGVADKYVPAEILVFDQAGWRMMVSWAKESAAYANAAWMSACCRRGYASSRSASVASSPSLRKISSTGIRVPRMTGLPNITCGLISIRSYFTQTGYAVQLSHASLLLPTNSSRPVDSLPPPVPPTRAQFTDLLRRLFSLCNSGCRSCFPIGFVIDEFLETVFPAWYVSV